MKYIKENKMDTLETVKDQLIVLRVSMYRVAQSIGIRPDLSFQEVTRKAMKEDSGWNVLAGEIIQEIERLKAR
jgi:hypothetical protein